MTGNIAKAKRGIRFALVFTGLLWFIEAYEYILAVNFETLGILPRTLRGSIGIVTAPLIHGDIYHLISNTFPIIVLVIGMFYFYHRIAPIVFFLIYFMTGFWVWIAARDAYHIGASGIVYGLISFLLFSGFLRKDVKTLAVSFAVLILYGSNMIYGLVPGNEGVSWESHVLGAIAGLFCAIYFKPKYQSRKVAVGSLQNPDKNYIFKESPFYTYHTKTNIEYHYKDRSSDKKYTYILDKDVFDKEDH